MHGYTNRGLQYFLRDTFGPEIWERISDDPRIGVSDFEAMLVYADAITYAILDFAEEVLGQSAQDLSEDFGTYLISHPNCGPIRRLMRFGGVDFIDFLQSMPDLPGRLRVAIHDMHIPSIELEGHDASHFVLRCGSDVPEFSQVVMGVIRAMADDYGALISLQHRGRQDGLEQIDIHVHDLNFATGRAFSLAGGAA